MELDDEEPPALDGHSSEDDDIISKDEDVREEALDNLSYAQTRDLPLWPTNATGGVTGRTASRSGAMLARNPESQLSPDAAGVTTYHKQPSTLGVLDAADLSTAPDQSDQDASRIRERIEAALDFEEDLSAVAAAEQAVVELPASESTSAVSDLRKPGRALSTPEAPSPTIHGKPNTATKRTKVAGGAREQAQVIKDLEFENLNLKYRIHFLEEMLRKQSPEAAHSLQEQLAHFQAREAALMQHLRSNKKLTSKLQKELDAVNADKAQLEAQLKHRGPAADISNQLERLRRERTELEDRLQSQERESRALREKGRRIFTDRNAQQEIERLEELVEMERDARNRAQAERDEVQAALNPDGRNQASPRKKDELQRRLEDLSAKNAELARHVQEQVQRAEEAEAATQFSRNGSGVRDETAVLEEVRYYREKLSETRLECDRKEREVQELLEDSEARDGYHARELDQLRVDFQDALSEADQRQQQLAEDLETREADLQELTQRFDELVDFAKRKDEEGQDLEHDVKQLSTEVTELSGQVTLFKGTCNSLEAEIRENKTTHERLRRERDEKRERLMQAVKLNDDLEKKIKELAEIRHSLEDELSRSKARWQRERTDLERRAKQDVEAQDKAREEALGELQRAQERMQALQSDNNKLSNALSDSKRKGEITIGLEIERDRLREDLRTAQEDIRSLRAELRKQEEALRDREIRLSTLAAEHRELESKLASQTSLRLALDEKLEESERALKKASNELAAKSNYLSSVESDLAKGTRASSRSELQHKSQLNERNTLLSTILQHLDRILGDDNASELRASTNFTAVHDRVMSRLRALAAQQSSWDKRIKDIDSKLTEQYMMLKREQDRKLKRLDANDALVHAAKDKQQQLRQKVQSKQTELDAARRTNAELQEHIHSLRIRLPAGDGEPGSTAKIRQSDARASKLERQHSAALEQIKKLEDARIDDRAKYKRSTDLWEERLKELEQMKRSAEEETKRERQGGKDRIRELTGELSDLHKQVESARRRDTRLGDIVAKVKAPSPTPL